MDFDLKKKTNFMVFPLVNVNICPFVCPSVLRSNVEKWSHRGIGVLASLIP